MSESVHGHNLTPSPQGVWEATALATAETLERELRPMVLDRKREHYRGYTSSLTANAPMAYDVERATQEELEKAIWHEEQFVKAVSEGLLTVMERNPSAASYALLFDVDLTLARAQGPNHERNVIRPSATPLMRAVRQLDSRVGIGLLSSRPIGTLTDDLTDPVQLGIIAPYLDPDKVISSAETNVPLTYLSKKYMRAANRGGYNPEIRSKVAICESLLRIWDKTAIVLVDDNPGFAYVLSDSRFSVVALDSTNIFFPDI